MMDSRPVSPVWEARRVTASWRDYLDPSSLPGSSLGRRSRCDLDDDLDDHLDDHLEVDHDVTEALEPVPVLGATWRDHLVADVPLAGLGLGPVPSLTCSSLAASLPPPSPRDPLSDDDADLDLDGSGDGDLFEPFSDTCGECECDEEVLDLDLDGLDLALFEPAGSEESSSVCSACCCRCKEELGEDDGDLGDPGLAAAVSGSLLYIYTGTGIASCQVILKLTG